MDETLPWHEHLEEEFESRPICFEHRFGPSPWVSYPQCERCGVLSLEMGEALTKQIFDGIARPWHDCCLYCCNSLEVRSECTRGCPCICTITTHETGQDETEPQGKE